MADRRPRSQPRNARVSTALGPRGRRKQAEVSPATSTQYYRRGQEGDRRGDSPGRTRIAAAAAPAPQSRGGDPESSLPSSDALRGPCAVGAAPAAGVLATRALRFGTRRLCDKAAEPRPETTCEAAQQPLGSQSPEVPPDQGRDAGARGSAPRDGRVLARVQRPVSPGEAQAPVPGAGSARRLLRALPARLSRPRQPWGTPSCHLAPSQRRTLTFPPLSSPCRLFPARCPRPVVSAPGPGAPPTTAPADPSQLVTPGSRARRRRTPSPPQVMLGRQASRARPPGPGVAPTHRLPAPETAAGQGCAHAQQASSFPLARWPLYPARL